jgi:hypothetical protein
VRFFNQTGLVLMLNVFGNKKKPNASRLRNKLPMTHAFVNFAVRGGLEGRICFEGVSLKTFRTTKLSGMVPGQSGMFTYTNPLGTFAFAARLLSVTDEQAVFNLPDEVKQLARTPEPERRAEARIDTTVSAEWRFKPAGKIVGAWSKVVVSDLSRMSATITVDRALRANDPIEVRLTLEAAKPIVVAAVIVRSEPAGPRHKAAINFNHVDEESSHVITRFVNRRMTALRQRGLG